MVSLKIKVITSGPLFNGGVKRAIRAATDMSVRDLVALGEQFVKKELVPGHGLITGHYRRSVTGEMNGSMLGVVHDRNVIYGHWLEGVSNRNKTTRFKGYFMFRKGRQVVDRAKGMVIRKNLRMVKSRMGG